MIYKDDTDLADRILMILNHFKLNKSKLARIANVTPTNIFDILSGKSKNPQMKLFIDISQSLDISIEWLMTGKGSMIKTNEGVEHKTNNDEKYERIIKDLLYDKLLLEIELGKQDRLTLNPSVEEIELSYASLVS